MKDRLRSKRLTSSYQVLKRAYYSKLFRQRFLAGIFPVVMSQLVGVQTITYSQKKVIDEAKLSKEVETLISMASSITSLLLDVLLLKKISKKKLMALSLLIISLDLALFFFLHTMELSWVCTIIHIILIQLVLIAHQAGIGPIPLMLNIEIYEERFLPLGGATVAVFTKRNVRIT